MPLFARVFFVVLRLLLKTRANLNFSRNFWEKQNPLVTLGQTEKLEDSKRRNCCSRR